MERILRFPVLKVMTLLVMGIIAVYSVPLPPPEVFGLGLGWTHIFGHFSAYLVRMTASARLRVRSSMSPRGTATSVASTSEMLTRRRCRRVSVQVAPLRSQR